MAGKITLEKDKISSNYQEHDFYDLIIIGAGISGLSTGLMWLKNTQGKKTLLVEKNRYPGGYVTAYEREGYVFETTQLFPDIIAILEYLDLDIKLKPYTGAFMRRIVVDGDKLEQYKIPTGSENFSEYLCGLFPGEAANIRRFVNYAVDLFSQVRRLKAIRTPLDTLMTPFRAPKVVACLNLTYSGLLDKMGIKDPRLREVLETFGAFSGVPSDRASSILAVGAMLSSMTQCFRPYGYYDEFPAKLATLYQRLGGELLLGSPVERIVVENGAVTGIRIAGGQRTIRAKQVVTTIDPNVAMRQLVGDEHLPATYIKRLEDTIMSPSSFNVSLGLDNGIDLSKLDIDYPYNVVSTGLGTSEKLFDAFLAGENAFSDTCFHAALICPSLTTGAKNTVTVRGVPFGINDWSVWRKEDPARYKEEKERWADFFIKIAEKYFIPGLAKHIVVRDISTPATYARWSGSPTGSIYDMASLVTQFGPKRLPMKTPIAGLLQPKFAHSIYGSMNNGIQVVDLMLDRAFNGGNSLFMPRGK
ncbi:MAG: NAD(P)/FAD-dependent oxidoreductase [Deltaproteobacteria bacterium]|nr:NAD(P)/FAD-dependent oxidoreductase [Candidatus Zymogenaceae bacterium]